jgi:phosphotransferase system IIB component
LGPEHARTTFEALINIGGWAHDIFNARENEDPFGTKETTRLRIASNQLSYSKYDYDKLQPGDIVHFRNGGFVQKIVGGHTAIIIGKKTNKCSDNQQAEY